MNNQDLKSVGAALAARHTRLNRARDGADSGASRAVTVTVIAVVVMAALLSLVFAFSS